MTTKTLPIVSRDDAIEIGQKWYFTGVACPRGHIAKRSVSNFDCRGCVNWRRHMRRKNNPERERAKDKVKYWRDPTKNRLLSKNARNKHIEVRRADDRARYHANPEPIKIRAKAWGDAHPEYRKHQIAIRRAKLLQATPKWLTKEQRRAIRAIYVAAPKGHEVDHIIPLRGKTVCGLHVPWNLQTLPLTANRRKSNRMIDAEA